MYYESAMAKRHKLLDRMRNNPRSVSMRNLQTLLESYGFSLDRVSGSHYVFVGRVADEGITLVIPLRKPHIKIGYVQDVLAVIDRLRESEENGIEDA